MAARGVFFAITDDERAKLLSFDNDDDRIEYVAETIEEEWDEDHLVETDKAWDAMHRCLSDFPPDTPWFYPVAPESGAYALPEDHGAYPLKLCVLGGRRVTDDESRYFIRLVEAEQVTDVAAALAKIDKAALQEKYFRHCKGAWPEYGETDFEYTWEYFEAVRDFYQRMAGKGRAVIFTADQ